MLDWSYSRRRGPFGIPATPKTCYERFLVSIAFVLHESLWFAIQQAAVLSEFLQPYKERPQTSKLLADRLVTGALGMRSKMTREERVKEREKLKEAKGKSLVHTGEIIWTSQGKGEGYMLCRYVPPQEIWILSYFGLHSPNTGMGQG